MSLGVPTVKITSSKTEYGRNKVALSPGRGLMDWIKLTSTKNIASQRLPFVTSEELIKHNKEDDCWILLRGNVYDVTKYLEYHPGGIPELMRAAGTDGGKLFDQYHAWVNYSSMLKNVLVGPFRGNASQLPRTKDPVFDNNPTLNGNGSKPKVLTLDDFGLCALKPEPTTLRLKSIIGDLKNENVIVDVTGKLLRIVVRRYNTESVCVEWEGFNWTNRNFKVMSPIPKTVDVIFENDVALKDIRILSQKVTKIEEQRFHPFTVEKIVKSTHNAFMFTLKPTMGLYLPVPIGHHLLLRLPSGSVQRPFTPITYRNSVVSSNDSLEKLEFYIKLYSDGKLTQELAKIVEGDTLEISEPIGRKDNARLAEKSEQVLMLAAGTGITPMVNIIQHRKNCIITDGILTKLIWFNRKEIDIYEQVFNREEFNETSLIVQHVLSEPDNKWIGKTGRIRAELLDDLDIDWNKVIVFVCGPESFNNSAVELLAELNVASERVIVFQ